MIKGDKKRKNRSGSKSQGTVPAFLSKTYEIIENPEYEDIVSWNREGNAFIVKRINDFSEKVLPKYFKHNNFASFVRQLNMYDFHKSRHENNENEFRHKLFKRGQKHLLSDIKRKISDGRLYPTNQLGTGARDFDMDKFKKETSHLSTELGTVKRHQTDLEKVTKVIYNQNTQLIKENKLLWNELTKNREKYEKKIEKLMMFIFSIMHNNGSNQLGPSEGRKALTDGEFSQKLGEIASDPEQAKNFFNGNASANGNEPLPLLPDRRDQEKFMQQMNSYFQSKNNEGTLDSLLEQIPGGNEEIFKNELAAPVEDQNIDPNIIQINTLNDKARGKPRGRGRKIGAATLPSGLPEENEFKEEPTKQIKREEARYIPQNIFAAPEPINMMSGDSSDDALKRGLSGFNLGLSRDPSFRESETGYFRSPTLQNQKSSGDFLYPNQKPFNNGKEDEYNLYNMNNFNNGEDKQMGGMAPPPKGDSQTEESVPAFSPYSFMNNTNQNGFNFGQPYDDTVYRS